MKVRNGFVSNSSSSSFVIIAPKNVICDALRQVKDKEAKTWIDDNMISQNPGKFLGNEVHSGTYYTEEVPKSLFDEGLLSDFMQYINAHKGFADEQDS